MVQISPYVLTFQVPRPTMGVFALVLTSTKVVVVHLELVLSKQDRWLCPGKGCWLWLQREEREAGGRQPFPALA